MCLFSLGAETAENSDRSGQQPAADSLTGREILSACIYFSNDLAVVAAAFWTPHAVLPFILVYSCGCISLTFIIDKNTSFFK